MMAHPTDEELEDMAMRLEACVYVRTPAYYDRARTALNTQENKDES